jgi:hypothetical protein
MESRVPHAIDVAVNTLVQLVENSDEITSSPQSSKTSEPTPNGLIVKVLGFVRLFPLGDAAFVIVRLGGLRPLVITRGGLHGRFQTFRH